jgi:hypothetical protein
MVWLVLESILAGAILIAIVWWTMSPARRRDRDQAGPAQRQPGRDDDDQ